MIGVLLQIVKGATLPVPMTARVVVTGRLAQSALAPLQGLTVWVNSEDLLDRDELLARVAGASAIVCTLNSRVDDELLEAAGPQLQVVANVAVGYNNIDLAACARRAVVVTNTPGVLTEATADIAMALILMVTRRLGEAERLVRAQVPWRFGMHFMLGTGITGRRLGIVGMGAIGRALARRASAHRMTITYATRSPVAGLDAALGAVRLSLDELLATSDVVSLHCPYTPETHHLIGASQLALMKAGAFLINTARGPIVDEAALVEGLQRRQIAGAGLDVYEDEPTLHPGLYGCEHAVLLPHLGSATHETRTAMASLAVANAVAVLAGQPPLTPVAAQ